MLGRIEEDISDTELKARWRLYWIQTVCEFAHLKLQQKLWIEGGVWLDGAVWVSSFEECMEAYFDHLALDDGYKKVLQWGNVTPQEAHMAQTFTKLALAYIEPDENPLEILKDPDWIEVTIAAQHFWERLKATLTAPREITLVQKLQEAYAAL